MSQKEFLVPESFFSIEDLFKLKESDFTDRTITAEHRDSNGAFVMERKSDQKKNADKLTQEGVAKKAGVPSRIINLIETNRGFPTKDTAKSIADALKVKKWDVLFPPGSKAHTRGRRQPAKLRFLLTGEEAYKRMLLNAAFLRGSQEDEEFVDSLRQEAKGRREYFAEIYRNHGLVLHYDLMLIMHTPEELVEQAKVIFEQGKTSWAQDRLNVAVNRVVFMHNRPLRMKLAIMATNPNIEEDSAELARLRMICNLRDEIKSTLEPPKRRGLRKPLTSSTFT
ncbi:helix-turn-helix transcriptional regulator [Candidatus Daviesbacteria bacterium]|nr:helix-turn-helix transcriptional regulator [Candidatus Daviesbacteria bacterium]